ncbi:MAG: site-specific DNA-methyltransferase [Nitrospirota bacterium]|nr:site-specific DNA-methyltransferase [Nitrospirota bacterium]
MSKKKIKLELTWIGKNVRPKLEPRILIEDQEKSYHAAQRHSENDIFDNRLIFGDNLLALKALEQEFAGNVKCIYVDPPYNTGSAFEHYDDGVEHSLWLTLMRDRLELLHRLLSMDGSLWLQLDDNEVHYCKIVLDEIFGRVNFVSSVIWQKVFARKNKALISSSHDTILVYAKEFGKWKRNLLSRSEDQTKAFKNPDNDPRGPWQSVAYSVQSEDAERRIAYRYPIAKPAGGEANPPQGRHWNGLPDRTEALIAENRLWFGAKGDRTPRIKVFLSEVQQGIVPDSWWDHTSSGNNQEAKKEQLALFPEKEPFNTPKPERLIGRIIEIASNPGDLVIDSFAGSGTTGAVAHKMGRRWIMVELGEHCHTHIIPRLKKVIDGEDPGGITKAVNWKGGGGFRYYRLGPSLIVKDKWGNPVINSDFNAAMLAEAMCKLEGFEYAPSEDVYWIHGKSTETDFLYVTTQFMSRDMLVRLSDEVGPERSLLICCSAFRCDPSRFPNLTIKKIPKAVLKKCEWGHDDYSLEVENLPVRNVEEETSVKPLRKFGKGKADQTALFDMEGDQ